jgi:Fic family protein/DNA-binding XRE family transcriptional regulator
MNHQNRLKQVLKASGWTQQMLADRLGVSFVTVNSWLNGKSIPRDKAIQKIDLLYIDILGTSQIDPANLENRKRLADKITCSAKKITSNKKALDSLTLFLTYNSNSIEGSTMTLADTKAVLFGHKTLTNRTQIEQLETRNHQAALLWILQEIQKPAVVISEQFIKDIHLRLMNGLMSNPGLYRNHSVRIMGSKTAVANYLKIPTLMPEFIKGMVVKNELIAKLALTHARFEKIHPFSDGNGRVGRLLMLALALKENKIPPIVLKEKKQAYYKYLELAQVVAEYSALELFIAESMISANRLLFGR